MLTGTPHARMTGFPTPIPNPTDGPKLPANGPAEARHLTFQDGGAKTAQGPLRPREGRSGKVTGFLRGASFCCPAARRMSRPACRRAISQLTAASHLPPGLQPPPLRLVHASLVPLRTPLRVLVPQPERFHD